MLTLQEYGWRIKAYKLQQVDKEYAMSLQAWKNQQVTATKEQNKKQVPVYKEFKQFFDYEKRIAELLNLHPPQATREQRRLAEIAKQLNSGKEVGNGRSI